MLKKLKYIGASFDLSTVRSLLCSDIIAFGKNIKTNVANNK
ncbi:hypothetical protein GLIP_3394 [Aliiglaciecola lipolytica E3]|uniref:Uncharacterized protein n=1 Tax=Aliiglaciecola lipolytica E3 TaxID=1127673 RepID=K6YHB0_9ALTE|nr:hypothetical protein GLIP_3394 [Aliiglaciecola lipolytica E3]